MFTVPQMTEISWCVCSLGQLEPGPRMRDSTQKFVLTHSWSPEVQSQHHWAEIQLSQGPAPCRGSRGGRFLPPPAPGGPGWLWLVAVTCLCSVLT